MMPLWCAVFFTALAPMIWGSTYIVTTEFLPAGIPLTLSMLRALPAGILLLFIVRKVPEGTWWWKSFALGALNFTVFWTLLFVSAYQLPGGVAAVLGAVQPLIVFVIARWLLGARLRPAQFLAAFLGVIGVGLLVLRATATLDLGGVAAGLGASASMAFGVVLTKKWGETRDAPSLLTLCAWQLSAGGLLLLPLALFFEVNVPPFTMVNWGAILWLSLFGAAISYLLWFYGVSKIDVTLVSFLGFLSPVTAIALGWVFLAQPLVPAQICGVGLIVLSLVINQHAIFKKKEL